MWSFFALQLACLKDNYMNICSKFGLILLLVSLTFTPASARESTLWKGRTVLAPNPAVGRLDEVLGNVAMVRLQPGYSSQRDAKGALASIGATIIEPFLLPEQSIRYQTKTKSNTILSPTQISAILRAEEPLLRTYIIEYSGDDSPEMYCSKAVSHCGVIEIAEPYYLPKIAAGGAPNDSLFADQASLKLMKAVEAWGIYEGDSSVVIAISDTGVLQDHEDIFGSLWVNSKEIPGNRQDDDGNGYPDDYIGYNFAAKDDATAPGTTYNKIQGHGMFVAGIACATPNNTVGLAGAGNKCRLFPLKCSPDNSGGSIVYAYQSIVYSALMGFPVVNCSWTSFNYSCLNQSIIDYAVSRNVVVVAAAGNHFASTPVYPASYQGVLGVGLSDPEDNVYAAASGYGTNAAVFAPAHFTWTTFVNDGEYAKVGNGTSYASPLAAGMMGLIRSRHPDLTPEQAIAFARICTDNIEDKNPAYRGKIGGRLNMLKAVTLDPLLTPAMRVSVDRIVSDSGFSRLFSSIGYNRGTAYYNVRNILGTGRSTDVRISTVEDSLHLITLQDTALRIDSFRFDTYLLVPVRFTAKPNATQCILRFDFTSVLSNGDTLRDFALINFTPLPEYYTHHTAGDSLVFSISDGGNFGYSDFPRNSQGEGFRFAGSCSYLYESGIMATNGKSGIVSQIRNESRIQDTFFVPVKQFNFTEPLSGIIEDQAAPDSVKLNIQILHRLVNSGNASVARFDMNVARMVKILEPITVGHYFNWHFGGGEAKINGRLLPEALPDSLKSQAAAVMLQSTTTSDVIGCAVVSCASGYTPMCRIFDNSITYNGFANGEKMDVMNGPVRADAVKSGDVGLSIGMNIATPAAGLEPRQPTDYTLLIAAARNSQELIAKLRTAIASACGALSAEENVPALPGELTIIPTPTSGMLTLTAPAPSAAEIHIMNLLGEHILPVEYVASERGIVHKLLDITALPAGTYIIQVRSGGEVFTRLCVKE
jgi:hypothetical protein